ncbi:MAG TPA: hypothetical protein PK355_02420, partial [Chitinophagales bacterium]|nr:hypothetical protein [Chitinophagales bacterium]
LDRMKVFEQKNKCSQQLLNNNIIRIGVVVQNFINDEFLQLNFFDNTHIKNNKVRKAIYEIKDKYGGKTIKRASELNDEDTADDVIGFGSVKDVNESDFG